MVLLNFMQFHVNLSGVVVEEKSKEDEHVLYLYY